jgi:thiol-disulfide isomerase/thioredoxin
MRPQSFALLLALTLAAVAACTRAEAGRNADGVARRPFRSFALETFDGDSLALADLEGKVALVTFWTSWCPACQAEMPILDSLHTALAGSGFVSVGINEDVSEGAARGAAAALGLRMPLLLGRGAMQRRYGYWGVPYSVLLDRQGRVVYEYYGYPGRTAFDRQVAGRVHAELERR